MVTKPRHSSSVPSEMGGACAHRVTLRGLSINVTLGGRWNTRVTLCDMKKYRLQHCAAASMHMNDIMTTHTTHTPELRCVRMR
jgi:hypothetical protein